jgi:Ca2+-binding EF-hand superfamily protein
MDFYKTNKI